jgi:uridine phosphorylase
MNIIDKWFRKMMRKVEQEDCSISTTSGLTRLQGLRSGQVMNFTIYKASGGFVIQYNNEDNDPNHAHNSYHAVSKTSNYEPKLLIVNNGEDLGKAIDQLILVEALKA